MPLVLLLILVASGLDAGKDRVFIPRPNGTPWLNATLRAYEAGQDCGTCLTGGDVATEDGRGVYYWSNIDTAGWYDIYANGVLISDDFFIGLGRVAATGYDTLIVNDSLWARIMAAESLFAAYAEIDTAVVAHALRVPENIGARGIDTDTLTVDIRLNAPGLRTHPPVQKSCVVPRGGMLSFRFDDDNTRNFIIADTLEARGMRGTFACNPFTASSAYLDTVRLEIVGKGHEVADHSPRHWFARGQSIATLVASLDSSYTRIDSLFGAPPRLFIAPGAVDPWVSVRHSDTAQVVLKTLGYDYGGFWSNGLWAPNGSYDSGGWEARRSKYNLGHLTADAVSLADMKEYLSMYFAQNYWVIVLIHLSADSRAALATGLIGWADSIGVPVLPISEAADVYLNGSFSTAENLFTDPYLLVDENTDGWPDTRSYVSTDATSVWYYPYATPMGTGGAILHPDDVIDKTVEFRAVGAKAGYQYDMSVWVKSIDRDGDYPDSIEVLVKNIDHAGNVGSANVALVAVSDSLWHRVDRYTQSSSVFSLTANDSTEGFQIVLRPTSSWWSHELGDTFMIACPAIVEVQEGATGSSRLMAAQHGVIDGSLGVRGMTADTVYAATRLTGAATTEFVMTNISNRGMASDTVSIEDSLAVAGNAVVQESLAVLTGTLLLGGVTADDVVASDSSVTLTGALVLGGLTGDDVTASESLVVLTGSLLLDGATVGGHVSAATGKIDDSLHVADGVAIAESDQTGWLGGPGTVYFHNDSLYIVKEDLSFGVIFP